MIDLHTHSIFSDGALIPSELIRRAHVRGYRAIAITDHVDSSNIDFVITRVAKACSDANRSGEIRAIPGVELTHVPPASIPKLVAQARKLGAELVLVHGETIVEPVCPGTNRAALESGVDILAHPGLIAKDDVRLARDRGICLEITTRKGHSLANGHVAALARLFSAKLVLNTDSHDPEDLTTTDQARKVGLGAGMTEEEVQGMFRNSIDILKQLEARWER